MPETTYHEKITGMRRELRALNALVPETAKGFGALSKAVKDNGPLSAKEKEYIALGMSVVLRCEPCINFHVEALMKAGATREELGDVLAMAVQMGGGPGLMYAGHALACWDELAARG
ncbi:carboxymuconolactone decarboxylase family protein [Tabrizicola sp. YIM 78059]|uniref:carboxymuconolactone decarboxylase family protein n=1 Tax=Tabrizicola sp. YIM 78059 TaxID=2529861 RepID=UPI0010A999E7|nr:carboxymuconolactone decarboxylase family protein [Tabrizicola sp. YIM 78059]